MFGKILNVLYGETRIPDVSPEVMSEMDKLGLVKAEYVLIKQFVDKETKDTLMRFNSFVDGKELMIMAKSNDMYTSFKNIMSANKNIIPIQMICVNHKKPNIDYILGINIYESIPIYYLATTWPYKPDEKMVVEKINDESFDISTWVDTKILDKTGDINEIITKMLLSDYYKTFNHYGHHPLKNYVSDQIYSKNNSVFMQQYIVNYINSLKIENNINIPGRYERDHNQFLNYRFAVCDVNDISKKIRHQLVNHAKFRYECCTDIAGSYYDFPLPRNFLKNVPLIRQSPYIYNDDNWVLDIEIKVYYGFINIDAFSE
jgi:hypothetical protein